MVRQKRHFIRDYYLDIKKFPLSHLQITRIDGFITSQDEIILWLLDCRYYKKTTTIVSLCEGAAADVG